MLNKLNFSRAASLGWSNIIKNKRRSRATIVTLSLIFGLLIGANFIIRGLETTLLEASVANTNGKTYVAISDSDHERITKYHGENIGTLTNYNFGVYPDVPFSGLSFNIINLSTIQDITNVNLSNVPEDKIPIIAPEGGFNITAEGGQFDWLREQLKNKYATVGEITIAPYLHSPGYSSIPSIFSDDFTPTLDGPRISNPILSVIYPSVDTNSFRPILIDDGSGKVNNYIAELTNTWQESRATSLGDWVKDTEPRHTNNAIVRFDNPRDLMGYLSLSSAELFHSQPRAGAADIFSNTVEIANTFNWIWVTFITIEAIIIAIVATIMVIVFTHSVNLDLAVISKNHGKKLPANSIRSIYLASVTELYGTIAIISLIIGLVISGIVHLLDGADLAVRLQEYYALTNPASVTFLGINTNLWFILLSIIIIAPLTLVFSWKRLATVKHK